MDLFPARKHFHRYLVSRICSRDGDGLGGVWSHEWVLWNEDNLQGQLRCVQHIHRRVAPISDRCGRGASLHRPSRRWHGGRGSALGRLSWASAKTATLFPVHSWCATGLIALPSAPFYIIIASTPLIAVASSSSNYPGVSIILWTSSWSSASLHTSKNSSFFYASSNCQNIRVVIIFANPHN